MADKIYGMLTGRNLYPQTSPWFSICCVMIQASHYLTCAGAPKDQSAECVNCTQKIISKKYHVHTDFGQSLL